MSANPSKRTPLLKVTEEPPLTSSAAINLIEDKLKERKTGDPDHIFSFCLRAEDLSTFLDVFDEHLSGRPRLQYTLTPPTVDVQINLVGRWHEQATWAVWSLLRTCFNRRISRAWSVLLYESGCGRVTSKDRQGVERGMEPDGGAAPRLRNECLGPVIVVEVSDSQTSADLYGKIERWFENHPLVQTAISLELDKTTNTARFMLWKLDHISKMVRVRFYIDFSPEDKDWETGGNFRTDW
ncbi:hypothetical protein E1B28_003679 [Marasmius oreades]|uniref:Uncharacterized protein n=1 Tax=Marasmius oreades TaxID=181124 RepID=A0A9P7UX18_9AGAR|nr:uncharacterized protein E1B28_003679 [Marasmius oreades]KAG7096227.1 hypothetical protein E1B28_003679 [Marasmius oreades]